MKSSEAVSLSEAVDPSPSVSVVTVTRNDLRRLQSTWDSLRVQDLSGFEWIVVDGASSDGTVDWLANLKDSRLRYVSEPDSGIYDAMNTGLGMAMGGLVTFLNAGDRYLRPNVLSRVVAMRQATRWVWGHGGGAVVDAQGCQVRPVTSGYPGRLRYAFGRSVVIHQTVFAETEVVRQLGGFDLRFPLAADVHLTMRLGRLCPPLVWRTVDVAYEEGGVSDRDPRESLGDMHSARVDVFGMGPAAARADAVWTSGVVAYVRSRRRLKQAAHGALGQRFIDWWARR